MRKLLALVSVVVTLAPAAAYAKTPANLSLIMDQGRPSRRFLRTTARMPVTDVVNKPTIQYIPLDGAFQNAVYGVSVSYPKSWEVQSVPQSTPPLTLVAAFLSPRAGGAVRQNVNLVIEDLPEVMTLDDYSKQGIEIEKNMLGQFTLLSSENISFFGVERAQRVTFTATSGGNNLKFQQIWFIRGRRAYVWTFADRSDTFGQNLPTFERMMDSFLINN